MYKHEVCLVQANRKPSFASDLDFGKSSVAGYVTYIGSVLEMNALLQQQM